MHQDHGGCLIASTDGTYHGTTGKEYLQKKKKCTVRSSQEVAVQDGTGTEHGKHRAHGHPQEGHGGSRPPRLVPRRGDVGCHGAGVHVEGAIEVRLYPPINLRPMNPHTCAQQPDHGGRHADGAGGVELRPLGGQCRHCSVQ